MNNSTFSDKAVEAVFQELQSSEQGLSPEVVAQRQQEYGKNIIPSGRKLTIFKILLHQFISPLVLVLIGAGIITLLMQEYTDTIFIMLIVSINAAIGSFQEWKAETNASALSQMMEIHAKVIRNGNTTEVDAAELVPGDIIRLEAGDKVPADLRLFSVNNLQAEEALLTGESMAVSKSTDPLESDNISLGDMHNIAFSGTMITSGRGTGIVTHTGLHTEIGKIAGQMQSMENNQPPLVKRMEDFSKKISIYTLALCILAGGISYVKGTELFEVFFLVIALAVSAIPEGLPIAITVALSIGSNRMAKKNVIVRKLTAVEGLGSCTVIATDKTGTLTVDQQTVRKILTADFKEYEISGEGYNDQGEVKAVNGESDHFSLLIELINLSNEAKLENKNGNWEHHGDPVDVAMLALTRKTQNESEKIRSGFNIIQEIPFESDLRFSGTVYQLPEKGYRLAVKGGMIAFENLFSEYDKINDMVEKLSAEGYRVIVTGYSDFADKTEVNPKELPQLQFGGLIALIDPIRNEVKSAIKECMEAGIRVAMITGDHPATALYIGKEIGIAENAEQVMTGKELVKHTQNGVISSGILDNKTVFARVSPEQKLQIVMALKEAGEFVAVTGDGVNDAPALKAANIGVAMGYGTEVAKEAASIIVTDNNFASITAAVEEGRYIYSNIRKVIYLLLSTGLAEILTISLALLFNLPIPFTAIQLLWLNLVTNGIQDIAMSFEKGESGEMKKQPRKPDEAIFNRLMIEELLLSGLGITIIVFGSWWYLIDYLKLEEFYSRNLVLMLMVIIQNLHVLNCRSEYTSVFRIPFSNNWMLIGAIVLAQGIHFIAMRIPWLENALGLEPVDLLHWLYMVGAASLVIVIMELYKLIKRPEFSKA